MRKSLWCLLALFVWVGAGCHTAKPLPEAKSLASNSGSCQVSDEVRLANLDEGQTCGAEVGFCRPGLTCRLSDAGSEQMTCHDDRVGIGEVCGTYSNIQCQQGAYCQLEHEGFDVNGVCKSVYKDAPES